MRIGQPKEAFAVSHPSREGGRVFILRSSPRRRSILEASRHDGLDARDVGRFQHSQLRRGASSPGQSAAVLVDPLDE